MMLCKQGFGLGVPLTPVMCLTNNCSGYGILYKKECLGHQKAPLFVHWRMYQLWKEGYAFFYLSLLNFLLMFLLFYTVVKRMVKILFCLNLAQDIIILILTFQRQCNKCLGLLDLQFYFNIIDRKCYLKLSKNKNIWRLNQV